MTCSLHVFTRKVNENQTSIAATSEEQPAVGIAFFSHRDDVAAGNEVHFQCDTFHGSTPIDEYTMSCPLKL